MTTPTLKLCPSASLESKNDGDLEQRLEKKLNDVKGFNLSINKIKEMITNFKDKIQKSEKLFKKYKTHLNIRSSRHSYHYWSIQNISIFNG